MQYRHASLVSIAISVPSCGHARAARVADAAKAADWDRTAAARYLDERQSLPTLCRQWKAAIHRGSRGSLPTMTRHRGFGLPVP